VTNYRSMEYNMASEYFRPTAPSFVLNYLHLPGSELFLGISLAATRLTL
jgi:hypothetical protein